jgi:hypothetical protein
MAKKIYPTNIQSHLDKLKKTTISSLVWKDCHLKSLIKRLKDGVLKNEILNCFYEYDEQVKLFISSEITKETKKTFSSAFEKYLKEMVDYQIQQNFKSPATSPLATSIPGSFLVIFLSHLLKDYPFLKIGQEISCFVSIKNGLLEMKNQDVAIYYQKKHERKLINIPIDFIELKSSYIDKTMYSSFAHTNNSTKKSLETLCNGCIVTPSATIDNISNLEIPIFNYKDSKKRFSTEPIDISVFDALVENISQHLSTITLEKLENIELKEHSTIFNEKFKYIATKLLYAADPNIDQNKIIAILADYDKAIREISEWSCL